MRNIEKQVMRIFSPSKRLVWMDPEISIPKEMEKFLSQENSVSALVKGAPGTGKTILVLSTIRILGASESFYLTTRVKPQRLVSDFPWIKEFIPYDHIVDATTTIFPTIRAEKAKEIPYGLIRYADKPAFLREFYQLIEKTQKPVIVIDSIETIQKVTGEETFYDLLDICREINSKIIFVSEYEEVKRFDYVVDGVILLKRYIINGKILRVMQIDKLRGIACRNPQYLFTLYGGYFRYFKPFKPSIPRERKRFEPLPDSERFFSTGSRDLDRILGGGYVKGSTILFEIGKDVERDAYFQLYLPTVLNFLTHGKHVSILASLGTSSEKIVSLLTGFVSDEELKNLSIKTKVWTEGMLDAAKARLIIAFDEHGIEIEVEEEGFLFLRGLDALSDLYKENLPKIIERGIFETQEKRVLTILAAKHGYQQLDHVANMVDFHFKIEKRNGVLLFHAAKPRTQFYAMEIDYTKGYPQLRLVPVE